MLQEKQEILRLVVTPTIAAIVARRVIRSIHETESRYDIDAYTARSTYEKYQVPNETVVVRLNAYCGQLCKEYLFDRCVFNTFDDSGKQISIVLHVDDLMVTSETQEDLDTLVLTTPRDSCSRRR